MSSSEAENHPVALIHRPGWRYPDAYRVEGDVQLAFGQILDMLSRAGEPRIEELVGAGDTVIIKPNCVATMNYHFRLDAQQQKAVTTHTSLIAAAIEYAFKIVGTTGRIIIADSPIEAVDFPKEMNQLGIAALAAERRAAGRPVELLDIRQHRVEPIRLVDNLRLGCRSFNLGLFLRRALAGDPAGYMTVDLGESSFLEGHPWPRGLRFYDPHHRRPLEAHRPGRHLYQVARSVIDAKLIINLPKLKTHKITGVTLAQKNLIGLLDKKYWLPHFSKGHGPDGDQMDHRPRWTERLENLLRVVPLGQGNSLCVRLPRVDERRKKACMPIYNGSWIGNDTLWRTVLDVAKVIEYADVEGQMRGQRQRYILSIIDGIVAGEGNGPLGASPKPCGVLVGGYGLQTVDAVAARLMGFRLDRIKHLQHLRDKWIRVHANVDPLPIFSFQPPDRWEGLRQKL